MRIAIPITSVALFLAGGSLSAQPIALDDVSVGVSLGRGSSPPRLFSQKICPGDHPSSLRAHGTLDLSDLFFLTLGISRTWEQAETCDNGLYPVIPNEGPYTTTSRIVEPGIRGYPFTSSDLSVGIRAPFSSGVFRAGFGPVWFFGKGLTGTRLGVEVALKSQGWPFSVLVGLDQTWVSVPHFDTEINFMDGQMVNWTIDANRSRENPRTFRVGLEKRF